MNGLPPAPVLDTRIFTMHENCVGKMMPSFRFSAPSTPVRRALSVDCTDQPPPPLFFGAPDFSYDVPANVSPQTPAYQSSAKLVRSTLEKISSDCRKRKREDMPARRKAPRRFSCTLPPSVSITERVPGIYFKTVSVAKTVRLPTRLEFADIDADSLPSLNLRRCSIDGCSHVARVSCKLCPREDGHLLCADHALNFFFDHCLRPTGCATHSHPYATPIGHFKVLERELDVLRPFDAERGTIESLNRLAEQERISANVLDFTLRNSKTTMAEIFYRTRSSLVEKLVSRFPKNPIARFRAKYARGKSRSVAHYSLYMQFLSKHVTIVSPSGTELFDRSNKLADEPLQPPPPLPVN